MSLFRWEPAAELNTIQNEMDRLFNTVFDQPAAPNSRAGAKGRSWLPAMDLVETVDHYVLRADLPGVSEEDVSIQLDDNVLSIAGERKAGDDVQNDGYYRIERAFGRFSRTLTLPTGIDPDTALARFDRGVLEITIPKPEQKKPQQIQINAGTRATDFDTIENAGDSNTGSRHEEPLAAVS